MSTEDVDRRSARGWIAARRELLEERIRAIDAGLGDARAQRGEWVDEEHDPDGFAVVTQWGMLESQRRESVHELEALDAAEHRVAEDRYGICDRCGRPVPAAQLELRPARTRCVACSTVS